MALADGRSACIATVAGMAVSGTPKTAEESAAILVDAFIALMQHADIQATPLNATLANGFGPVYGSVLGATGGLV